MKRIALVILIAAALVWTISLQTGDEPVEPLSSSPDAQPTNQPFSTPELAKGDAEGCLTAAQLEVHPSVIQEAREFAEIAANGDVIDAYRGLSLAELQELANQQDSAAMVAMAGHFVVTAFGYSGDRAIDYLQFTDPELVELTRFKRDFPEEQLQSLRQAQHWFYEAALHGRYMALVNYGRMLHITVGTPVDLGWIGQSDYDALPPARRSTLWASNTYYEVIRQLIPGWQDEVVLGLMLSIPPSTERQREIAQPLVAVFEADRKERGIPAPTTRQDSALKLEELMALLCDSEIQRLEETME